MLAILIPNRFFDPDLRHITVASSLPGTWRFGLWFTDACRAGYCRRPKWPQRAVRYACFWPTARVRAGCISR